MKSVLRYLLPRFDMRPRIGLPPVLSGHEPDPGGEVTTTIKGLARADGGHHRCRNDRADAWNRFQALAMRLAIRQGVNLAADTLDPFIKPEPVLIETDDDVVHPFGNLVAPLIEDWEQRLAKRMSARSNGDALLDQKGADLIDRRRAPGHQPRSNPMQGLQVELVLALLSYGSEVRPQRRLGDGFGIIIVVLLDSRSSGL